MGAVPVSGTNFYKLMSSKSHSLLFPGGVGEALHRKIPYFRDFIEDLTEEAVLLRNEGDGEVSNQQLYQP
ncbi:hypothetical protein SLEP1_g41791 [Rubroshorea leprosula]|uniref:Uncharacterized protein n=1 Tax=Rubroshorea leprosula TaxID=152421 RepID=A0AAV5L7N3_9ROSI|nr:hypothetical protein SLEP1_g41791 [Rubroshorea leprosula]